MNQFFTLMAVVAAAVNLHAAARHTAKPCFVEPHSNYGDIYCTTHCDICHVDSDCNDISITNFAADPPRDMTVDSLLRVVYDLNQGIRLEDGINPNDDLEAYMEQNRRMQEIDLRNQEVVFGLLDGEGWPEGLSEKANEAIWLVIQHADTEYQKKYFDLVRSQAEQGLISKSDLATLHDRILMHEGQSQIYGTQTKAKYRKEGMLIYIWPVEDPDNLDSIRADVGLGPMAEYMDHMRDDCGKGTEVIWDNAFPPDQIMKIVTTVITITNGVPSLESQE